MLNLVDDCHSGVSCPTQVQQQRLKRKMVESDGHSLAAMSARQNVSGASHLCLCSRLLLRLSVAVHATRMCYLIPEPVKTVPKAIRQTCYRKLPSKEYISCPHTQPNILSHSHTPHASDLLQIFGGSCAKAIKACIYECPQETTPEHMVHSFIFLSALSNAASRSALQSCTLTMLFFLAHVPKAAQCLLLGRGSCCDSCHTLWPHVILS